jgi:hypothetical protein
MAREEVGNKSAEEYSKFAERQGTRLVDRNIKLVVRLEQLRRD